VAIVATVAANGGDAAIVEAAIETVRDELGEAPHVTIYDSHPELVAPLLPGVEVRPDLGTGTWARRLASLVPARWRWRAIPWADRLQAALRRPDPALARADVVLATGGTWLVEQYDLTARWLTFRAVRRARRPLVLLTMSAGPFTRKANRRALARLRPAAAFVRDELSARHLAEVGIDAEVVPDLAFALRPPPPRRLASVIVSVREWGLFEQPGSTGTDAYERSIVDAVTFLVRERGETVRFLSTCQGLPGYRDDSVVAEAIAGRLPDDVRRSVVVDRDWHSVPDLLAILAGADLVISTRMHLAILALVGGTPALPIAYEFKTTELYRSLGGEAWVSDVNAMDPAAFVDLVRRFDGRDLVDAAAGLADAARRPARRVAALVAAQRPGG
jgi:colanic acid/amylovoran biosynthesis protein